MKKDPMTGLLVGLLGLSALASVVLLLFFYAPDTRELRHLQSQIAFVQQRRVLVNALLNDTYQYSRQHPKIDPLLKSLGVLPTRAATAPNPKSGTK